MWWGGPRGSGGSVVAVAAVSDALEGSRFPVVSGFGLGPPAAMQELCALILEVAEESRPSLSELSGMSKAWELIQRPENCLGGETGPRKSCCRWKDGRHPPTVPDFFPRHSLLAIPQPPSRVGHLAAAQWLRDEVKLPGHLRYRLPKHHFGPVELWVCRQQFRVPRIVHSLRLETTISVDPRWRSECRCLHQESQSQPDGKVFRATLRTRLTETERRPTIPQLLLQEQR